MELSVVCPERGRYAGGRRLVSPIVQCQPVTRWSRDLRRAATKQAQIGPFAMDRKSTPSSQHPKMTTYHSQAVLRRASRTTPLRLAGVTLDKTFFPRASGEATGPLTLARGLVALAPLAQVEASDAASAAVIANVDARDAWAGLDAPRPAPERGV
jgi:hypothetical protein